MTRTSHCETGPTDVPAIVTHGSALILIPDDSDYRGSRHAVAMDSASQTAASR